VGCDTFVFRKVDAWKARYMLSHQKAALCHIIHLPIRIQTRKSCCDKWVPVTTAWHVLRLQMEEWPPIWRVAENMYGISSGRQLTGGGPSAWRLGEVLTTPHCKNISYCEPCMRKASDLD
jgi:hypothetical protein